MCALNGPHIEVLADQINHIPLRTILIFITYIGVPSPLAG